MNRLIAWMLVTITLTSGCSLFPRRFPDEPITAPIVLTPDATLDDVTRVVNENSGRIEKIQVSDATLSMPNMPSLQASYAMERPRRFRLTAETTFTGRELDLGSNDDTYWIWVRRDPSRALYFGQHDRFYESGIRDILPVPPTWLTEALGVVRLDPRDQHEGPFRSRPGQIELRSRIVTPSGELTKITVVDDQYGWVVEQQLYDTSAGDQLLAAATASDFYYDHAAGVSLPRTVDVRLPPADIQFTLRTRSHVINQIYADPQYLWTMPRPNGSKLIDVSTLSSPAPRYAPPRDRATADLRWNSNRRPIYRQAIRRLPPFRPYR